MRGNGAWGDGWTMHAARDLGEGQRLAVWRSPWPGRPVVAVHGMEDSWRTWHVLAQQLAGQYQIYALDLPWRAGNGYAWRRTGYTAYWLSQTLSMVEPQPEIAFGHSLGANVLLRCMVENAPALSGLAAVVLHAPFFRPASVAITDDLRSQSVDALRRVVAAAVRIRLGERRRTIDPEIQAQMEAKAATAIVADGFPVFFSEFVTAGTLDLRRLPVPTLVLAGSDDEALKLVPSGAFPEVMPGATVIRKPFYSHFCHIEQAADVVIEIKGFLDGHPPSPSRSPRLVGTPPMPAI